MSTHGESKTVQRYNIDEFAYRKMDKVEPRDRLQKDLYRRDTRNCPAFAGNTVHTGTHHPERPIKFTTCKGKTKPPMKIQKLVPKRVQTDDSDLSNQSHNMGRDAQRTHMMRLLIQDRPSQMDRSCGTTAITMKTSPPARQHATQHTT